MILLLAIVALAAGTTHAHGKEHHAMGTVTAMTEKLVTVSHLIRKE